MSRSNSLNVAVCGASGYAGSEICRLLLRHPRVKVTSVTSERSAGKPLSLLFPHLGEYDDLTLEPLDTKSLLKKADFLFLALPHAASQAAVDYFFKIGKPVVDLSADYRLRNPLIYEQWYKTPHAYKATLEEAVYGMPELYRSRIRKASLVANPGCYPTGAILGLYPAIKGGIVSTDGLVIDSKSGVSGAGRKSEVEYSFCEINEGFRAYAVATHRHTPEIEQELSALAREPVALNFTPHLLPINRGILTTTYARFRRRADIEEVRALYEGAYRKEPFVNVLPPGVFPDVKHVRGTNHCSVGFTVNPRTNTLVIVTAIDNLIKGAAGQAVHNMNLMMGFKETAGLDALAVSP